MEDENRDTKKRWDELHAYCSDTINALDFSQQGLEDGDQGPFNMVFTIWQSTISATIITENFPY